MSLWIIASFVLAAWALLSVVGNEQVRRIAEAQSKIPKTGTPPADPESPDASPAATDAPR